MTKPKTIDFDVNPLWLLHYLKKLENEKIHLDTLYYTIKHKTKSEKILGSDNLEHMLNYIGFQINGNYIIKGKKN